MSYSPLFRGSTSAGSSRSSRSLSTNFQNGSGGMLIQCTPVAMNASGQLIAVDPSDESTILQFLGVCGEDIPNAASGSVYDGGRLENISIGFSVGDALYLSKAGFLTSTKPSEGVGGFVSGDFVVFIGLVVKNEFNPLQKDLKLMIDTKIGQL